MKARIEPKGGAGRQRQGILYHVQAFFVVAGLILTLITFVATLVRGAAWPVIAGILATLVAYGSVLYYAIRGYRDKDQRFYLFAVYSVIITLFIKALIPLHTALSEALIILGMCLLLVFTERMQQPQQAKPLIVVSLVVLALAAIVVMVMPLGVELSTLQNFLARLMPWTQVVLVGTLALAYWGQVARA